MVWRIMVVGVLLCELEDIKDKLLHLDTIGFTWLHPAQEKTLGSALWLVCREQCTVVCV